MPKTVETLLLAEATKYTALKKKDKISLDFGKTMYYFYI